jgi:DNA-binding NarL/FixJ family response regulator
LLSEVRRAGRESDKSAFRDLSDREIEVLTRLAKGRTNAEIARDLGLTEKTVGNYVSNILRKMHLKNRIELAAHAHEHHLFDHLRGERDFPNTL